MRFFAQVLLAFFLVIPVINASAQERLFTHQGVERDAKRYEKYLRENWTTSTKTSAELETAGSSALANNPRAATRAYAAAVVADDKNVEGWIGLSRALLAVRIDPNKGSERYDLPVNASGAAYLAYQRAKNTVQKARALAVLGAALRRRSYWRPAIDALKASLALSENGQVRAAYGNLRAERGFRMTNYKTESETVSPRLCLQFSERLSQGQIDFAKFISVDGKDPEGVAAEGKQLCINGLAHGQRYEVQLRAGLPSDVDEDLQKNIAVAVYVPDRKPFVRFSGRNYVLPSRGQQGIPLVSVNTNKVEIEVYRIGDRNLIGALDRGDFQRQLSSWEINKIKKYSGQRVFAGKMDVPSRLNEEVTAALPVTDAVGQLRPGVYVAIAKPTQKSRDDYYNEATQWFIVSDLGLTVFSGNGGVHAFVRSLADARPTAGVSVKLIARNNEILGTTKSDTNGYARFEAGLTRGEGGLQPALLVAENDSGEYAFLDLTSGAFDLTDHGVKGREAPGPLDAYLYTERGVYRPGEDVHIAALVRDKAGKAATLPVILIVSRPDGVEHRRFTLIDEGLGGRDVTTTLSSGAMTGTWRAKLHTDPQSDPITQVSFLVEDFLPERLDLTLEPPTAALSPKETQTIRAVGRYLYGPPAADLSIDGDIIVKPSEKGIAGYPGYKFGKATERINPVRKPLDAKATTDVQGKADIAVTLPPVTRTAMPLEATVMLRLRETGGRTVERNVTIPVDLREPRIGIKPLFKEQELDENQTAAFDVIMLDGKSQRTDSPDLNWHVVRLDMNWQWYRRDGRWNYEPVTLTRKVAGGTIATTANDAPAKIEARLSYGRYRIEVASADPSGPASSVAFNAGWHTTSKDAESPEILNVALDRANYKPGDTAKLRIETKTGGKALIAVLSSGLLSMQQVDVAEGGAEVDVTIGDNWGPGAYVTAVLYRPMDERLKRMPSRAIGVQWLGLDQSANTLHVTLDTAEKINSGTMLTVPVNVTGLESGESARITLAAVDLGILNLTRFKVPAPESWFYAQRRMGLEIRDFYGRLIDGMRAERGSLRTGGDGGTGMSMRGSPPVENTVALFSGIVKVDAEGKAKVEFDLPDFNGTVRVMAVAWTAGKLGHASRDVIVRDAVALTASGPRFLTLGDEARLNIAIHNVEGAPALYSLEVSKAEETIYAGVINLKAGERRSQAIRIKPTKVGELAYDIRVTGPGAINVTRHLTFDVKPPAGDIKRTTVTSLKANGGNITLSPDLVHGLIPGRTHVTLSVGPTAAFDVPGLLTALDRYPYGCAEQTVSRALPLVYANAVAAQLGIATDKELKERVQQSIDRVFEMQDSSGAFGSWGPHNANMWLTSYVGDFLTRAKEQGFKVNPLGFSQALDRLQNYINYAPDLKKGGEDRAYALYVLARNGRAPIGELRYYADTRLDRFATPLAQAQLGAALAMMGDKTRAQASFRAALAKINAPINQPAKQVYRVDYGSNLRDSAALVTLAVETGVAKAEAPRLADVIAKAYSSRTYTSTQEQAWMLLAANALSERASQTKLVVDGAPVVGSLMRSLAADALVADPLVVTNDSDTPVDTVVTVMGAALTPEPPASKGFTIERSYYTLDGAPVELASATGGRSEVNQNDRLVAVVKLQSNDLTGRVLLVDHLPAGFEIENPRLVHSGDIASLSWLKTSLSPEHREFRDDRLVAAFDFGRGSENRNLGRANGEKASGKSTVIAYVVRAVTPGTFVHPAATVEDMYRPERYARTAAGELIVTANEQAISDAN